MSSTDLRSLALPGPCSNGGAEGRGARSILSWRMIASWVKNLFGKIRRIIHGWGPHQRWRSSGGSTAEDDAGWRQAVKR